MRSSARRAAMAAALLSCFFSSACRWRSPPPLNVLLVVVDTLRPDHLPAYGYRRMTAPTLTRLAAEGAVLDGLSPTSWTKPAVASILTGLHPLRHQALSADDALPAAAVTLAERLRERGYRTLAFCTNPNISHESGFDQGFDALVAVPSSHARDVGAAVLAALPKLEPPFFLYVHYLDPHAPYDPPRAWDGSPLPRRLAGRGGLRAGLLDPDADPGRAAEALRDAVDLYDGEVRAVDDSIAALHDGLRARGLLSSTVTVVTADHGEEFEEHGAIEHDRALYEESVRVPLIVHAPGRIKGGARHGTASLLDVSPTVLDLLGVAFDATTLDGVSLAPWLRDGRPYASPERPFLLHLDHYGRAVLALRRGSLKLLLTADPPRKELYDLAADPQEKSDLGGTPAGLVRVRVLANELAEAYNHLLPRALPRTVMTLSGEAAENVAALGYVASGGHDRRTLPPVLPVADPAPDGPVGWAGAPLAPCVRMAELSAVRHFAEGWYQVELGGRWTRPVARVVLGRSPGDGRHSLEISGVNHERTPMRFRVAVDDRQAFERVVAHGPFTVRAPIRGTLRGDRLTLRIERTPPFIPARQGLRDDRELGVFLTALCLVAER